jgi:ATP-dependent DNA helicase DinG
MADVFGPGGLIEKCMPDGYEHRRSQLCMAELVEDAFRNKRHLLVEAGTGTGKTLAYLIPAIRSGRRVVISTATKSLQEQLYVKDVPFVQKHFAPELKVAVMKGRANFLCREKLRQMEGQPVLKGMEELDWFAQIRDWERLTETGDRADLTFLPDDAELWSRLDARRETCTGQKCAQFERCFITAMHQRAADADVIIVNHHLFFADLALRQDDFGSILPEYSAVIFDEAHEIEDVASDYFGRQVSNYRLEELARDAEQAMRITQSGKPPLLRRVTRLREKVHGFFDLLPPREGRSALEPGARAAFLETHRASYDEMVGALKALENEIAALPSKPDELLVIARRAAELRSETAFLFESNEKNFVYWLERRGKGVFITATPIDVSSILRQHLFDAFDTIIMTSATLAVSGRFDFLKQRLGLQATQETVLPHEFDYRQQALLYIPAGLPDVRDSRFVSKAAEEICRLLAVTEGRAFCLFTSYGQMNQIFELVRAQIRFPMLLQGTAPRMALLERFRTTPHAVLFATSSFWQGVDVPGQQLSCVIIDRLPFAVPTDPIVAARVRTLTEEGRNAFAEYQIPEAVLALKQGFGRLIRTRTDRGVLAILDNRIQRMQYGKIFIESLPEYSLSLDIAEVQRFMKAPS